MIKVIKDVKVYAPNPIGVKDILIVGDKIITVNGPVNIKEMNSLSCDIINGKGKILFPGFIDNHVHILGGGGEGGFKTRTPEIFLSQLIEAGITTVVGCLGTDGVTRNMYSLIAKANGLNEEGITAFVYTGSYRIPVVTLTGEIIKDFMIADKVIGVGEIAISDHRSSQPTYEEFKKVVADARVGGMLSGKAGVVNIHMGDEKNGLMYLRKMLEDTQIPVTQILPTHINRNTNILKEGIDYSLNGGYIDFTTSLSGSKKSIFPSEAMKQAIEKGVSDENITFSSDGQGSLPMFDNMGNCVGLGIGSCKSLYEEVRKAILDKDVPIESAIKAITSNPAKLLKLNSKGKIEIGCDADLCIVDEKTLELETVIAKGKFAMLEGKTLLKGTFEK